MTEYQVLQSSEIKPSVNRDVKNIARDLYDVVKGTSPGTPEHELAVKACFKHFEDMQTQHGVGSKMANDAQRWANSSLRAASGPGLWGGRKE